MKKKINGKEYDIKPGANLEGANLKGANLKGADTKYCVANFSPNEYKQAKQFIEGLKILEDNKTSDNG